MDQLMPVPPGRGSFRVTAVAVPVPAAAEFDTVMVKPMVVPADTGVASAVFVMESPGAWTTMVAEALTLPVLVALAVADVVALEMWTLAVAPGARLPKEHVRTWEPTAPVMEQDPGPA